MDKMLTVLSCEDNQLINVFCSSEKLQEFDKQVNSDDPHKLFQQNEIIVGNYRMKRETSSHEWTVSEVAQISSVTAWPWPFKMRWKGRLSIATRGGYDFYKLLRVDYLTDYIVLMVILLPPGLFWRLIHCCIWQSYTPSRIMKCDHKNKLI